jgi:threonine/homoserine/homoserine lactone efflux protein
MSLGIHNYWMFFATGIVLNITPGQDTLYIVGRSLAHGRTVGVTSALGVCTGGVIHAAAAAVGLSAILATSAVAFTALKWVGAAYLIYLGVRMLASASEPALAENFRSAITSWVAYRQGVLTNVTNPKVAMFFLAFLPQFIDPAAEHRTLALLLLGVTFNTTGLVWCLVLALAAGRLRGLVLHSPGGVTLFRRLVGSLYVLLGLRLASSKA